MTSTRDMCACNSAASAIKEAKGQVLIIKNITVYKRRPKDKKKKTYLMNLSH